MCGIKPDLEGVFYIRLFDAVCLRRRRHPAGIRRHKYPEASLQHGPGVDEPLAVRDLASGQSYYYSADGLGSITDLTDVSGNVVQSYLYDSFGNIVQQTGAVENFYTYTGREFDAETGLYYYRARYYDAAIGRFLQEDPIGFAGGINFYSYVLNAPHQSYRSFWSERDPLKRILSFLIIQPMTFSLRA